jgi:16S rRNA processing protein RimM
MKTEADDLVVMGRIVAPYGILGWVKVKPDTEQLDGLLAYKTWLIGKGTDWREVK